MRRGEIDKHLDVYFHLPEFEEQIKRLRLGMYPLVNLEEISIQITDGTHVTPTYVESGFPFISVKDVRENAISFDDTKFISEAEHIAFSKRCSPKPQDILLTKVGTIGMAAVVPENAPEFDIFVSVALIKPNKEKVLPDYLCSILNNNIARIQFDRVVKGVGVPDLHLENIREILIPLPSLDVQQKLVAEMESARATRQSKLAEADNLLKGIDEFVLRELDIQLPQEEKRQTFAVKLSKIKQGRQDVTYYKPYYEKLVNSLNKSKFPKIPLEDISPDLVGGATPTRGDTELYAENGIKFLRILNIGENEIILEDLNYIKEIVHNGELKRSQLAENDVLMTITGRVGTSAVVSKDILPANINQHIVRMRITHQECLPEYLAIYLNSSVGKALSNRGVTGGTRIALDYEVIKKIQIPLPPREIQEKIIKELHVLQSQARQLRQEAEGQWQSAKEKFEKALLG